MKTDILKRGISRIEWADTDMPVLQRIRERFAKEQPFRGVRLAAVLHVTAETANLVRALKAGGAEVHLAASNPLSTQDDVVSALNQHYGITTYAKRGESKKEFFAHIKTLIKTHPHVTMDDGADLVSTLHTEYPKQLTEIYGGTEETTTGVIRLRSMSAAGALRFPVVAVNDAKTKNLFDNRYGTGQSTIDSIMRATDVLIAGKTFVIAGYGWCGKGLAQRARGMGARVIITEVDAVKALEAAMDGCSVMKMKDAASIGDIFCTVTGNKDVITAEHFKKMKDGAIVCNSGHFDVEVSVSDLQKIASKVRQQVRAYVDEYTVGTSRIHLLAEGRLVNLGAAEGHPASVMDMSFATQALSAEWIVKTYASLDAQVHPVPEFIEDAVSREKLKTLGIAIDTLTPQQKKYLASWQEGT
jgi:adenosylhomocysteinase